MRVSRIRDSRPVSVKGASCEILVLTFPSVCVRFVKSLNAKIVAANFSCSAKVVFVKEKRWLCQSTEAPATLYHYYLVFIYTHIISCALFTAKAKKLAYLTNSCRRRFARSSSTCSSYVPYSFVVARASARYIPSFAIVAYTVQ